MWLVFSSFIIFFKFHFIKIERYLKTKCVNYLHKMDINNIIKLSGEDDHKNLVSFLYERFSNENQRLFVKSFYMTLIDTGDPYPIDGEDVRKWLEYTRKGNFKRFYERHIVENVDYIVRLRSEKSLDDEEDSQEKIKMTVDAFKKLSLLAGTDQGNKIRMYYIELEKHLFSYGISQAMKQLQEKEEIIQQKTLENQALEEECENLRNCNDGVPIVYIYDTDTRVFSTGTKDLKIGITEHYRKRSKPFKGVTPFGRMVFSMEVPLTNLRIAEKWLHTILAPYHTANEMFKMDPEEARMWIIREINTLKLANNTNWPDKHGKLSKLIEMEKKILDGEEINIIKKDICTQTDDINEVIKNKAQEKSKFDQFIEECCILNDDVQVSSTDIIGQYRIWAKSADKETFHAIQEYLKKRFIPIRMKTQFKDTVVNGFGGVQLILDPVSMSASPTEAERFIYANFNYTPSGKILMADLIKEYEKWIKTQARTFSQDDIKLLKDFLKSNPRILISSLWTENGSGQGYYGIQLKSNENHHRKSSSTAKKIEKRDKDGNFLKAWTTIAKAAEDEGMGAATMSRCVKNKKILEDGSYYICI